jgi:IS5 family transposase
MITDFRDFCLYVFVIVDDIWKEIAPLFSRPGPTPECSDSELIAIALISECRGWNTETELLDHWQPYLDLFPHFPERSRFNRRRRNLMSAINLIRKTLLKQLDLSRDGHCVIDSLPVPAVAFHLVPSSSGDWAAYGAKFGRVSSKKETIFGYKLHLLITLNGVILDFELAPANATDLKVGEELLLQHSDLIVLGDKGYVSAEVAAKLLRRNGIRLLALRRKNQKKQLPKFLVRTISKVRQIIETVNNQLSEQFDVERNRAHSFWGLCARLYTKLTAHTICIYINRLLGNPEPLHIKALAFPNI